MEQTEQQAQFKTLKIGTAAAGIAHLCLAQPEKANAMSRDFWIEFPQAIRELSHNEDNRALIISGAGKHFSSGMDLSVFSNNDNLSTSTARDRERLRRLVCELQETFSQLESLRFPTIAAIQGACIGAGFDLIAACDMRFATRSAFFCVHEINLAMMADLGVLQRLLNLMPEGIVRELAFTGDKLSAERALALGLINAIFETEEEMLAEVVRVAARIASKSPLAIAASKEALNYARDNSVIASLEHASLLQSAILDISDLGAAAKAASKSSEASFAALLGSASI